MPFDNVFARQLVLRHCGGAWRRERRGCKGRCEGRCNRRNSASVESADRRQCGHSRCRKVGQQRPRIGAERLQILQGLRHIRLRSKPRINFLFADSGLAHGILGCTFDVL